MDDGGSGCGEWGSKPVGSKPAGASPYGVLDMSGEINEWVQDCWHCDFDGSDDGTVYGLAPTDGSAWEDDLCVNLLQVVRGGSWYYFAVDIRASAREARDIDERSAITGFRCCRTISR